MTEAEARARIVLYLNPEIEPIIASGELDLLLDIAKMVDKNGIKPGDSSWTETYDWSYAVSQGWLIKATRLADRYLFMSGGKMLSRNQFYEHCIALHQKFANKSRFKALRLTPDPRLNLAMVPINNAAY